MPWPTRRIPIQAIPSILAEGTKETVKHLYDSDENVEFEHGLAPDPVVEFSDGDRTENVIIDEPDQQTLQHGVQVSTGNDEYVYCQKRYE